MDTITATKATERAEQLRKQLAGLHKRKGEVEVALQREHGTQEDATAKRAKLVGELAGADEATAAWAHNEIDGLDCTLRLSSRVAEGLSQSLSGLVNEIAALNLEFTEARRAVEQETAARDLEVFGVELRQGIQDCIENLAAVRKSLAAVNVLSAKAVERHADSLTTRIAVLQIAEAEFEKLFAAERNLTNNGWHHATPPFRHDLQFVVRAWTQD
jgi:hypothetical protein